MEIKINGSKFNLELIKELSYYNNNFYKPTPVFDECACSDDSTIIYIKSYDDEQGEQVSVGYLILKKYELTPVFKPLLTFWR